MDRDTGMGSDAGGEGLAVLDPKLTIYALANGMDLRRRTSTRRLEWHREGLERGVLLDASTPGYIAVMAQAWAHGDEASVRTTTVREGLPTDDVAAGLSGLLEEAMEVANGL